MLKTVKKKLLVFLCILAFIVVLGQQSCCTAACFTARLLTISNKAYVLAEENTDNISASFNDTAPSNIKIETVNTFSHKISWEPLPDADGYYVYCSSKKSSGYSCIGSTSGTSMHSMDLKIGTVYYYKVQAYKVINGEQCYSRISDVSAKAAGHPGTPSISIQNIKKQGKKVAVIRWSNISDAKYIQLYRKKAGQKYQKILDKKITKNIKNGVTISYVKTSGEMQFKARTYNKSDDIRFYSDFSQIKKIKLK